MQSYTPTSPSTSPVRELLSRFLRTFRTAALAERPAMRWAEMRPIDFQGEVKAVALQRDGKILLGGERLQDVGRTA